MLPFYEKPKEEVDISYRKSQVKFPAHFHSGIEITYCFKGRQTVRVGGKTYVLKEGEAVIIFPNVVHEEIKDEKIKDETERVAVICGGGVVEGFVPYINNMHPADPFIPADNISEGTKYAFREITKTANNLARIGWMCIIMSDLMQKLTLKKLKASGASNIIERLAAYITINFKEPLTLDFLAEKFGVNKSYLSHIFSDKLNINFRHYLGMVRADYAAKLIRESSNDLTGIAFEAGFGSVRSFNRVFFDMYGVTPSEYRKNVRVYLQAES